MCYIFFDEAVKRQFWLYETWLVFCNGWVWILLDFFILFCICIQFKHFFLGEAIDDENNGALSLGLSSYEDETTAFSSVASVGMCNAAFYQFENRDIHEFSASHQLDNNKDIRDLLSSSCCSNNGIHPSTYLFRISERIM